METNAFASLTVLHFPAASRLLPSACCPDKDLVLLISRQAGKDRLALWNVHGSKKWEVDTRTSNGGRDELLHAVWSPDGQNIAVAHDPPRITIHSVQNGLEKRIVQVFSSQYMQRRSCHITGIWWFSEEKVSKQGPIPDIFRRNGIITGTSHSILQTLPLLDNLHEESEKSSATDIFAFQGSQIRPAAKTSLPDVIQSWPSITSESLLSQVALFGDGMSSTLTEPTAQAGRLTSTNILAIADNLGRLYFFLDGSYPLGVISLSPISLDPEISIVSLHMDKHGPTFLAHPQVSSKGNISTDLKPTVVQLPLLATGMVEDMAIMSSTARELAWYSMRVVKEMRTVWFGSDSFTGARELGPKWVRALKTKQKDQFGQEEPDPILDLTCLLVTGRASESLVDFLGSGEQMSERGIQKWESTVVEALMKLRDFAEKRVAPAFQRLHLVLSDIQGRLHLPQFVLFELAHGEVDACLDLIGRAIVITSWLAAVTRRELSRFREFILWLRYGKRNLNHLVIAIYRTHLETTAANPTNDASPTPRHDILEVNNYFISGLVVSSIDKWFMGPVPQFLPKDLGVTGNEQGSATVLQRARAVAQDPAQVAWQFDVKPKDLSHIDRNLDALTEELVMRCQKVFVHASSAAARSAVVSFAPSTVISQAISARPASLNGDQWAIREWTVQGVNEERNFVQYLASHTSSHDGSSLYLSRIVYPSESPTVSLQVGITALDCVLAPDLEGNGRGILEITASDFFDDEYMIIVFRYRGQDGPTFIATVRYNDLGYQALQPKGGYVMTTTREELILGAMQQRREGKLPSARMPIKRYRKLVARDSSSVSLALNGRVGRRIACILSDSGTTLETVDLEGDADEVVTEEDQEGNEP